MAKRVAQKLHILANVCGDSPKPMADDCLAIDLVVADCCFDHSRCNYIGTMYLQSKERAVNCLSSVSTYRNRLRLFDLFRAPSLRNRRRRSSSASHSLVNFSSLNFHRLLLLPPRCRRNKLFCVYAALTGISGGMPGSRADELFGGYSRHWVDVSCGMSVKHTHTRFRNVTFFFLFGTEYVVQFTSMHWHCNVVIVIVCVRYILRWTASLLLFHFWP